MTTTAKFKTKTTPYSSNQVSTTHTMSSTTMKLTTIPEPTPCVPGRGDSVDCWPQKGAQVTTTVATYVTEANSSISSKTKPHLTTTGSNYLMTVTDSVTTDNTVSKQPLATTTQQLWPPIGK